MDATPLAPGSVVVGLDASAHAALALQWAARQAALERRTLTLVHATGPAHPVWLGPPATDLDDLRARQDQHAREVMADAATWVRTHEPGVGVRRIIARTDPRQELLHLAESAAMVVLGSRGRGPVAGLLLGSVSLAVSAHATCPVVVLRPDATERPRTLPLQGVLVGVQGEAMSRPTLELAFRLASSRAWPLTVLHCCWDEDPEAWATRSRLADTVAAISTTFPEVDVAIRPGDGFLDQHLVELSSTMDAVVVGTHHPGALRRAVYGSLARTVLEHAEGTVVVVPVG